MKKILFAAVLMAVCSTASFAQLMTSRMTTVNHNHKSKIWLDLGAGAFSGDVEDTGLGVDLGLRYTHMFTESIGWDILKVSAQTDTKNFDELLDLQLKTGVRYVSPVLFGSQSLYANGALGYGYFTDIEEGGFVWELGAGINITPRFSVGIAYNSSSFSMSEGWDDSERFNVGFFSLRLGLGL